MVYLNSLSLSSDLDVLMPYVKQKQKDYLKENNARSAGELNYKLSCLVRDHIRNHGQCYDVYNEVIGVLECAKLELYRRQIAPYEDKKINENGDIYDTRDYSHYITTKTKGVRNRKPTKPANTSNRKQAKRSRV